MKDLPRDHRGRIYIRLRPEKHALQPGEVFNPRHHSQHYHVEIRRQGSWNKGIIEKLKPQDYRYGDGTGLLPGELFPGIEL